MRLRFSKMHCLGEDFIVIDGLTQHVRLSAKAVRLLADRKLGVGCQRVLVVEAPSRPDMDFRARLLDKDGSVSPEHYQAAVYCLARFVWERQLTARRELHIEILHGPTCTAQAEADGLITIGLEPIPATNTSVKLDQPLELREESARVSTINLEQNHAVILVPKASDAPVKSLGRKIQQHPQMPSGVNVGFMAVLSSSEIELRVLQPTGSEGLPSVSHAIAAVVVGHLQNLLAEEVTVRLAGEQLTVHWKGEGEPLLATGPATLVYQGQIHI